MKLSTVVAVVLFSLIATAHVLRLVLRWEVTVNGASVPLWVSLVGSLVPAAVAFMLWRDARR